MSSSQGRTQGFTLIELTIALSVISILSIVLFVFFANNMRQYAITDARSDLLNEARLTLDTINEDIRLSAIADENNRWEDEHAPDPENMFSWASDADTLILASAAEDSDGNILFSDPAEYISWKNNDIYFLQDGELYHRILAAPVAENTARTTCPASQASAECPADKLMLNRRVDTFVVRYIDGDNNEVSPTEARSIELEIGLSRQVYGQTVSAAYTTRMVFRND